VFLFTFRNRPLLFLIWIFAGTTSVSCANIGQETTKKVQCGLGNVSGG